MPLHDALNKISERHPDIVGAIASHNGQTFHNLEAPYDMIAVDDVMGIFSDMFDQAGLLEDEGFDFADLLVEFDAHCFVVRKLEGGIVAVVTPEMARGQLVKLQVGLPLFGKAIQKAFEEQDQTDAQPGPAEPAPTSATALEPINSFEAPKEPVVNQDEVNVGGFLMRSKAASRAARALGVRAATPDAVSEPTPKEEEPAQEAAVNEEGVPLNPDGTPKKKRIYRGQVYYE